MLLFSIGEAGEAEARTREGSINPAAKKNFIILYFFFHLLNTIELAMSLEVIMGSFKTGEPFKKIDNNVALRFYMLPNQGDISCA